MTRNFHLLRLFMGRNDVFPAEFAGVDLSPLPLSAKRFPTYVGVDQLKNAGARHFPHICGGESNRLATASCFPARCPCARGGGSYFASNPDLWDAHFPHICGGGCKPEWRKPF